MNLLTYNYLKWKSQRNRSVWLSEILAWISTGVGHYFAFYQKLPLKFLNLVRNKNHSINFGLYLALNKINSGVSNKLKHFKAANFQENIALIFTHVVCCLHYNFLLSRITMLLYISVHHEFIKRGITFRRLSRGMLKYPELAQ